MKKNLLSFALIISFILSGKAQNLKPDFKLHKVTVYLVGAELNYKTKTSLPKGRSTIAFASISKTIIDNSVRVKIDNEVKIISVSLEEVKANFEKEINYSL